MPPTDRLYPYQERAIRLLLDPLGPKTVAYRYGSGKAWVALEAGVLKHRPWHMIVVCKPRNFITWEREAEKRLCGDDGPPACFTLYRCEGTKKQRQRVRDMLTIKPQQANWLVMVSHTSLANDIHEWCMFAKHATPNVVIYDESTAIKNPKAQRTKAALKLTGVVPMATRITLTGNPIPENPLEIWTQLEFNYPGCNPFGRTYYQFTREWFIAADYGLVLRHERVQEYQDVLAHHAIWLTADETKMLRSVAGFPASRYVVEQYELNSTQYGALQKLESEWALCNALGVEEEYNYATTILTKAQQICSGFYYDYDKNPVFLTDPNDNPKVNLLREVTGDLMAESHKRKMIVWRAFRAEDLMIQNALAPLGCVIGPAESSILQFMDDPNIHVIVMPLACGQGLNELVKANANLFFSNVFSQESRDQAEARIVRSGQTADIVVHIDFMSPEQRDADVVAALQSKTMSKNTVVEIVRRYADK